MAERRPIVLVNGKLQELPTGDTLPGGSSGGGSGSGLPTITGNAGKKLRVKSDESGVEWGFDYGITPIGPTPHGAHRYWRLTSMYQDDMRYAQVAGLKFRGVPSGPNLATGGTAIESGHYSSNVAANAFDGNSATVWEGNSGAGNSASGNIWIGYDFGAPVSIVEVEVEVNATYETGERPRAGWVHYSDDGANWVAAWPFGTWTWDTLLKVSTSPFYASTAPVVSPNVLTPPLIANFPTLLGIGAETTLTDLSDGANMTVGTGGSGTVVRCMLKAYPTAPFSVVFKIKVMADQSTSDGMGLIIRDSAGGRLIKFGTELGGAGGPIVQRWNSNVSFSGTYIGGSGVGGDIYYKFEDDGTNHKFYVSGSKDGPWYPYFSQSRTAWLPSTMDQIGFGIEDQNAAWYFMTVQHYAQT